jgi:Cdc6-like AAA superfamily ATPase
MSPTDPPGSLDARAGFAAIRSRALQFPPQGREELASMMALVLSAHRVDSDGRLPERVRTHLETLASVFTPYDPLARDLSERARPWLSTPSPVVRTLAVTGEQGAYVQLIADALRFAASLPPVEDAPTNTAQVLVAVQSAQRSSADAARDQGEARSAAPLAAQRPHAPVPAQPDAPAESLAGLFEELDGLIGLTAVKAEVKRQAASLRVERLRAAADLRNPDVTRHLVFTGNPGTGKTTVARLVARIYAAVGLLATGQLVEVDRSGLVAGYVGQSEQRTAEVIATAVGGVLFIDEAYALVGDTFADNVVDTLVKAAEDGRDDMVIILAGYTEPMTRFLDVNPGLASRFATVIEFEDYTDDELVEIFCSMAAAADYEYAPGVLDALRVALAGAVRDESFGNARFVRNIFEDAVAQHAWRLRDVVAPSLAELRTLIPEDFASG